MATLEQLEKALVNADAAGDVDAATALATELKRMRAPAAVSAGKEINSIPRQIGLTARYGLEGLANTAQLFTEPIRAVTDLFVPDRQQNLSDIVVGRKAPPKSMPLGVVASQFADKLGLPKPANADERVIGDATRLMAGAGGLGGTARLASAAPGAVGQAGQFLSQNMGSQLASAAGAGLAGGASREAGGSPLMQAGASLLGGVGAGVGTQAATDLGRKAVAGVRNLIPGQQQLVQQRLDQRINIVLQNQGIDPATITPAMRSAMREQVQRALDTGGELNPEAVARLADYTRLGLTPTRARLTLDPFDVTQEQNLSRLAAATGSRDARLPQIAQDNNRRLVGMVDEMGGARPVDTYGQGQAVIRPIQQADEAMTRDVRSAYDAYRQSTGRDLPIPLNAMRQGYNQTVRDFGDVIPSAIRNRFDEVLSPPRPPHTHGAAPAAPQPPRTIVDTSGRTLVDLTPRPAPRTFSIDEAENLIKTINRHYNPADRAQARALDDLRQSVQRSIIGATEDGAGMESATLANFARDTARRQFGWRDSSPVIQRALGGANADTFVQNNVISKAAGFDDLATAAQTINGNPAARDAVRTAIMQKLKDSAIGRGGTSQTANFSGKGMEAALKDIGDRKLSLFFTPEEVQTLHAMARTGAFETFQPRGSAVNNSNSGAAIGAMLMSLADRVRPVANRVPGVGPVVDWALLNPLENVGVWAAQRPTMNVPQSLLRNQPRQPMGQTLLLPGLAYGGLLAAPHPSTLHQPAPRGGFFVWSK